MLQNGKSSQDTIVHKIDMQNNEIQNGAWLTVRPGRAAVFVNKGQIADVFGEGRHQLTQRRNNLRNRSL